MRSVIGCFLLLWVLDATSCEITMGYRISERLPFINRAPDSSGVYLSLYQQAANEIGCTLSVVRAPKKRILKMLDDGSIDFYPGMGFTKERSKSIYFIENGLTSHTVLLTHKALKPIKQLEDLTGLVQIVTIASNNDQLADYHVITRQVQDLSLESGAKLIAKKQVDFLLYNKASLTYFLNHNDYSNLIIQECCFAPSQMLLGFSRKSKHLTQLEPLTSELQRIEQQKMLEQHSIAAKFERALKRLAANGVTNKLVLEASL